MATIKIASLPSATTITETDLLLLDQADATRKLSVSDFKDKLDLVTQDIISSDTGASMVGTSDGTTVQESLDNNIESINMLRQNLASSDGAKLVGGLNYVTPEMSGYVTGAGDAEDDTAAIQWALNQNAALVVLDSTKTYNINPGVIQHTGKINVDAGTAKIVCDGIAVDVIDGAGSVWRGGNLLSKTTPWTVVYDDDFTIAESGYLGYGRMPYQDDPNVDSSHYYQQICCALVFRSSSSSVLDGLTVSGVRGSYAAVVVAGFKNTDFSDCKIRGGALAGAIMVLNDCQLPITAGFGWNAGSDVSYANSFKWGRGANHKFTKCDLFESRQMGLFVAGSDYVHIVDVNTYNNAESGVQTGQYSAAYPEESIVCKHVIQRGCKTWGNYYDGFDHATVTNGANGPYFDKYLNMSGCESFKNRATGMIIQGNNLAIGWNDFHDNGAHGISLRDSSVVDLSHNQLRNNGILAGGYQIVAVGSDMSIVKNGMQFDDSITDAHLVNISVGNQTQKNFGVIALDIPFTTYSSPDVVLGNGVELGGPIKLSSGESVSYSGIRATSFIPQPKAGNTEAKSILSEGGAVAAWKHPYTGAYMRMYADDLSGLTNGPMVISYNWGRNNTNPNGYADNAGLGGTKITFNPTSIRYSIRAAGSFTEAGGVVVGVGTFRPITDNTTTCGEVNYRFTQLFAVNSTVSTSDARHKTDPRDPLSAEVDAAYEIGQLPWVWQWLHRAAEEGDAARLHSGPTVQAAISIMDKHGLDWRKYAAFCYDEWQDHYDEEGNFIPAGSVYSFRKEELLLWILRATIEKQKSIEARLSALEGN